MLWNEMNVDNYNGQFQLRFVAHKRSHDLSIKSLNDLCTVSARPRHIYFCNRLVNSQPKVSFHVVLVYDTWIDKTILLFCFFLFWIVRVRLMVCFAEKYHKNHRNWWNSSCFPIHRFTCNALSLDLLDVFNASICIHGINNFFFLVRWHFV